MKTKPDIQDLLRLEPELRRAALQATRNAEDADDVLQEMWLAILCRRPRAVASQRAWLRRMVRNLSASLARSETARRRREAATVSNASADATDEIVERTALRRHLLEHVLDLEEPYRRTLLLRYVADMEPGDIATYLGIPSATVRVHCHRGLERLRVKLRVDDPGRRRAIMAVVAPWLLVRRAPGRVAWRLAAAVATVVAAVALVTSQGGDERVALDRVTPSGAATAAPVARRNDGTPRQHDSIPVADDRVANETPKAAEPVLVGNVRLEMDGGPVSAKVTVDAELLAREEDTAAVMAGSTSDENWRCDDPDVSMTTAAGVPFTMPLTAHGHYRLFIRAEGVLGGVIVYHSSRAPLERTVRLAPHLLIEAPPGETPRVRVPVGNRSEAVPTHAAAPGRWRVEGPLFPGAEVTLDGDDPAAMWQRVNESETSLRSVRRSGSRRVRLLDAASGEALDHARVDFTSWTADSRVLFAEFETDVYGEIAIPLLELRERELGSRLHVRDRTGASWCLEPATRAILGAGPGRIQVEVGCALRGAGVLMDADGHPVEGAAVIARVPGGPPLVGRSDQAGRFEVHAHGGSPPPRLIDGNRILVGHAEPPERATLEIDDGKTVTEVDVAWADLEHGVLRIEVKAPQPAFAPPPPLRTLRVVDENSEPLAMIRVAVSFRRTRAVYRDETDHRGVMRFPDLDEGDEVAVRVFAPGRRLSLRHRGIILPGDVDPTFTTARVDDVAVSGSSFVGSSFVAIVTESPTDEGRRHAFFGPADRDSVPLNREAQRITVYSPRRLPVEVIWNPATTLHSDALDAPPVTMSLAGEYDDGLRVLLRAGDVSLRPRHAAPLAGVLGRFDVEATLDAATADFGRVTPGAYRLCVIDRDGERELRRVRIPDDLPVTISHEN